MKLCPLFVELKLVQQWKLRSIKYHYAVNIYNTSSNYGNLSEALEVPYLFITMLFCKECTIMRYNC